MELLSGPVRYVDPGEEGRRHDRLDGRCFFAMKHPSPYDLHVFQLRLMRNVVAVGHGVVNSGVKKLLLELLDGEADASPVLVVAVQVGVPAVYEDEVLGLPVAGVLVTVDLSVHP